MTCMYLQKLLNHAASDSQSALCDQVFCLPVQDHFIFTVESTGALAPEHIVRQSIDIIINKLEVLHRSLEGSDQAALAADMNMG